MCGVKSDGDSQSLPVSSSSDMEGRARTPAVRLEDSLKAEIEQAGIVPSSLRRSREALVEMMVSVLLDNGASVDLENDRGNTALMFAARAGYPSVCRLLLKNGASLSHVNQSNDTALIAAVSHGHASVCSLLLDHGADPSSACLCVACELGFTDIAGLLIRHGAIVDATAVERAVSYSRSDILAMLLSWGAPCPCPVLPVFSPAVEIGLEQLKQRKTCVVDCVFSSSSIPVCIAADIVCSYVFG